MSTPTKTQFIIALAVIAVIGFVLWFQPAHAPVTTSQPSYSLKDVTVTLSIEDPSRVTKKTFGLYITPANSPVQPEKFTGYHTGVDFETTSAEANIDIPVPAFCDGKLLLKKYATGYGGVAVQSCTLDGQVVTIIYGHLKLTSITSIVGQQLNKGNTVGVLSKGYSTETDGERKHLHLAIHKSPAINILGYVQKQSDLSAWLDPMQFLK